MMEAQNKQSQRIKEWQEYLWFL